jgi:polyisoprenoid-binding protein YceI
MKTKLIALFIAAIASSFSATATAADAYTIDSRHTFPSFEINHLGFSMQRGRFNHTTGKVTLDPKAANGGSVDVTIDTASISTGLAELEEHLRSKDFLDAARYPQMKFVSTKLIFNKEQLSAVDGNLTLHGVTKPVHLTVDHFHCGLNPIALKNVCGVNAYTVIKRSEFGVDKYVPAVGDEVKIVLQVEATKD